MKKLIISILILLGTSLWAQETDEGWDNYLPAPLQKKLSQSDEIFNILREGELPKAMPSTSNQKALIEEIERLNPSIGIEVLTFYPYPDTKPETRHTDLELYNILNALSSLKGIEYYSASRKRMRIFYHDAYRVESTKSNAPQPDTSFTTIPPNREITAYFKDSSFGNYYSKITYQYDGDIIHMKMENLSQIWYFIVPLLEPGGMVSSVTIIPTEQGIIFYGLSYLKILNLFGIAEDRIDSLYNRMKAIYHWFTEQL